MNNAERYLKDAYELTDADTSEDVRALYDKWAEVYDTELVDENSYVMPRRAAAVVARHQDDKSARLLDVGCGTGLSGAALTAEGFSAIDGCDLSPGMLERAAKLGIYRRLFEADLTKPPLDAADASYDVITVVGAFSFAHVPVDAMDDLLRILKPGGLFLITTNDHFFKAGTVSAKLNQLTTGGRVERLLDEHGSHIEGLDIDGWVFLMRRI